MPKLVSKMFSQELPSENGLVITRKDTPQSDGLTYVLGSGFRITASRGGVSFAGNTVTMDIHQLETVRKYINHARIAHLELATGCGLIMEGELDRTLKIHFRTLPDGSKVVWFKGHKVQLTGHNMAKAVANLRDYHRTLENRTNGEARKERHPVKAS